MACLAHEPGRRYRREWLIEELWPGETPERGRPSLRVALAYLRQVLEPEPQDRGSLIVTEGDLVYLRDDAYVTDVTEFKRLTDAASQSGDDAARIEPLRAAIDAYPADLLPDFDAAWISAERVRLADSYHQALRKLARAHAAVAQYDLALEAAQRSLRADPEREETHRLLMQVLALMGRPHAAIRQYRDLEEMLRRRSTGGPSRSTRGVLADLCRIAGVPNPTEAVVAAPAPPAEPPAGPPRPAFRLPAPLTATVGREEEIIQLADMLDTPGVRLVTLTGLGGVGKTRLALSVAARLRKEGRAVCYVPLAGAADPEYLLSNLATALHLRGGPADEMREQLIELLHEQPIALVLDNLEHLLPAAAGTIRELLETAPTVTCLATSRHRMGLAGEHEFAVRPLPVPADGDAPVQAARCASVRLWLDRVRAIQPQFEVTAANCADVVRLCRRLEGLPLAIELAAAWGSVLTPGQVATRLARRFELLVSRDPTVEPRHASIEATLDWSFDHLPGSVQRFLERLAVFPDGWTIDAARDVGSEPAALDYLALLKERSLVCVEAGVEAVRYRLLETVREYALSRLSDDELAAANGRMVAHYLALAEQAEPELRGAGSADWMHRLQAEDENLRAALKLALAAPGTSGAALRLSLALYRYWYIRGVTREGREALAASLAIAGDGARERDRALMALGNLAYAEGDLAAAERFYTECRSCGSRRTIPPVSPRPWATS